jgi:hypothetical protein
MVFRIQLACKKDSYAAPFAYGLPIEKISLLAWHMDRPTLKGYELRGYRSGSTIAAAAW